MISGGGAKMFGLPGFVAPMRPRLGFVFCAEMRFCYF